LTILFGLVPDRPYMFFHPSSLSLSDILLGKGKQIKEIFDERK
jgi:hypothetical protein